MLKSITTLFLCLFVFLLKAQTPAPVPTTQQFGKIDKADLEMKACDFEKDANAEVLFDKGTVYFDNEYNLIFDRHIRIKIFNDNGKDQANIKIPFYAGNQLEYLSSVQAETFNLNNGAVEISKVDKKLIYTQKINKFRSAVVFAFPNVKAGSIIEYKYSITTSSIDDFPDWYFQTDIPTRYSELNTNIPSILYYKNLVMVNHPYVKNTEDVKAIMNIPSIKEEPYMSSARDNEDRILYQLLSVNVPNFHHNYSDSWEKVGNNLMENEDFCGQIRRKLTGEEAIIIKAKGMKTDAEKIAFIFNTIKDAMKWNEDDSRYVDDGTAEAWIKKTGNATEINLMIVHLLQKAGIKAFPMLVSTKGNGKVNPGFPSTYQFNRTVAYIPVDSTFRYILDASSKYNIYNATPSGLLNGFGFYVDKENQKSELIFLDKNTSVRQLILINAEIKPDAKMHGTAQVNSFEYNRINALRRYKTDGEEKYIKYLREDDNNLKISGIKFDNMEVDTLPLTQNINFDLDLAGSDENYIYFKPNLFAGLRSNPFLSENRLTDIDFSYRHNYAINGLYKIPAGYKTDALPKSVSMAMSDKSIVFRRVVGEQEGTIIVRFSIDYKKSIFFKEDYPELHEFYKKMQEMLDEQVVLKKS